MEETSTTSNTPIVTQQTVRLRFRDRSEVSLAIKYLIFAFNILIWVIGALLIAAGSWALTQKDTDISMLEEMLISPVILLLIAGCVTFIIGFFGCIGALRENTCLLIIYMILVGLIFLCLVAGAVIIFAFQDWLKTRIVESPLQETIVKYRDDADLQNFVDWVQAEWLHCCGLENYDDWEKNLYFNCSSPGVEKCGVPYSCCQPDPTFAVVNLQCGYNIRLQDKLDIEASKVIYVKGCIEAGEAWFRQYMIPVAGAIVGACVVLLLGLCCAWNLLSDIQRQKDRWNRQH